MEKWTLRNVYCQEIVTALAALSSTAFLVRRFSVKILSTPKSPLNHILDVMFLWCHKFPKLWSLLSLIKVNKFLTDCKSFIWEENVGLSSLLVCRQHPSGYERHFMHILLRACYPRLFTLKPNIFIPCSANQGNVYHITPMKNRGLGNKIASVALINNDSSSHNINSSNNDKRHIILLDLTLRQILP